MHEHDARGTARHCQQWQRILFKQSITIINTEWSEINANDKQQRQEIMNQ